MQRFFQNYFFPVLLILIASFISVLNYTSGTWLTGWDTLHPEFDFLLNFKRILFGVWRGDQGLGAVAAHSHMVELPRMLILWLFSLVFDSSVLRYLYIFLCFIVGPLGVYIFLKKGLCDPQSKVSSYAAFLGSMFYIFNLATMQQFFVPFEMFMAQYAALGWLFYFATTYLLKRRVGHLMLFAVISFFASSMAYASLLWYAFAAGFTLYLGTVFLLKRKKTLAKGIIILMLTLFATNAYWLLPNWYFLKTHAAEVPNASTNILFSEEAFLHNKQYGTLQDAIVFKNFLFNWNEQVGEGLIFQQKMLVDWDKHLANPLISGIGYFVFIFVLGGVVVSLRTREPLLWSMLPVGAIALIMIVNMNPPFSWVFDPIREHLPLFKEGLRFPWTKFSLLLLFAFSVYFGIFWQWLFARVGKLRFTVCIVGVISILLIIYCFPMFQGKLIDKQVRIAIPNEYFEVFAWINAQTEQGRVAPLPIHSPWGWEYYSWGYQGSGFLWFGIDQPVLARDFDRWNSANEQYYRLMSSALYARDVKQIEALAQNYQIRYFVLDESVIFPENKPNALWFAETKDIFAKSTRFHLAQQFGKVSVYTFDLYDANVRSYLQSPRVFTTLGPQMRGGYQDQALLFYPNYLESEKPLVIYPFRSMIERYGRIDPKQFSQKGEIGYLTLGRLPSGYVSTQWDNDETFYPSFLTDEDVSIEKESILITEENQVSVAFPITTQALFLKDYQTGPKNCGSQQQDASGKEIVEDFVALRAVASASCDYITIKASHDVGYLLVVETRNKEGLPIRFCVASHITRRCDTYTSLTKNKDWTKEIFVIPPYPTGPSDSAGFDIHFNTISIGNVKSENDIRSVQLIPFPYYRLNNFAFINEEGSYQPNGIFIAEDKEIFPLWYKTQLYQTEKEATQGFFVLNQSFDEGWVAFVRKKGFPFFQTLGEHTRYNNWANSWVISDLGKFSFPLTIEVVFVPQILQFIGFILLPLPLIIGGIYGLVTKKRRQKEQIRIRVKKYQV